MTSERERVICITLSEAEWQAFVARQPQPVNWLRERIRDEVSPQTASQSPGQDTTRTFTATAAAVR